MSLGPCPLRKTIIAINHDWIYKARHTSIVYPTLLYISLISITDKVELIATEFFSNPATIWVILSNIRKVASPILWGRIYISTLK